MRSIWEVEIESGGVTQRYYWWKLYLVGGEGGLSNLDVLNDISNIWYDETREVISWRVEER